MRAKRNNMTTTNLKSDPRIEPKQECARSDVCDGTNVAAKPVDTKPLDGARALLNLWILVFHVVFFIMYFVPEDEAKSMFESMWFAQHGYLAVDGFFVLTGFLLALSLLKASNGTTEFSLRKYYYSRFIRIMPAYFILFLLHCFVVNREGSYLVGLVRLKPARRIFEVLFPSAEFVDNGCANTPSNIFHLNMFMPYNGCFMHAWSVAVQYHCYLWLPFAWKVLRLHEKKRMFAFTAIIEILTVAVRATGQLHSSTFREGTVVAGALELFWYSNTLLRAHTIVIGMCFAHIIERTDVPKWLISSKLSARVMRFVLYVLPVAFMYVTLHWKDWFGDYRYIRSNWHTLFITTLAVGSPIPAIIYCWLFFCCIYRVGLFGDIGGGSDGGHWGMNISNFLSSKSMSLLADLSYVAYLIHPLLYNVLFARPWLLYPPSGIDQAPWSLVTGQSAVDYSNASFVPEGSAAPYLNKWFEYRDALFPRGQPLGVVGGLVYCTIAIVVVYGASYIVIRCLEQPLVKLLRWKRVHGIVETLVWWYSIVTMVLGPIAHLVGFGAMLYFVDPKLQDQVEEAFQTAAKVE